jgi:putative tryptophan/tyrosine transport system substrate-binding protein
MRRREFIAGLGGAAAWPLAARAQQPALPMIGYLNPGSGESRRDIIAAFRRGLAETGYIEGRNILIEFRHAEGQYDRLPALAADLVGRSVAVIVTGPSSGALAAKAATTTIPIVFETGGDPVELGLVASLNRPGGNLTGVTTLIVEVAAKRVELLHDLVPAAVSIALPHNPASRNVTDALTKEAQRAASALGLRLLILNASSEAEIETSFETLVRQRPGALLVSPDPLFTDRREHIVAMATRSAIPAIYAWREYVEAGGLMSYGTSRIEAYRLVEPADLPVQRATKVELIINMKTARALGLTFPLTLPGRADEVIE